MCKGKISELFVSKPHLSHTNRCPSFSNLDIIAKQRHQLVKATLIPYVPVSELASEFGERGVVYAAHE